MNGNRGHWAAAGALSILFAAPPAVAVKITQYPLPSASSVPQGITVGPDGRIWVSETNAHKIAVYGNDGTFGAEYPTVISPHGITPVPGSSLAYAGYASGGYGLVNVAGLSGGEFPGGGVAPWNMVFAPDGRLWTTDLGAASVTAYHYLTNSPGTATVSISYPPFAITLGPDGRVWVTAGDAQHSELAACPLDGGPCTEYHLPTVSDPGAIAAGADGNVWFTERATNHVARMTPAGVLTEFPVPTAASVPFGICAAADGNLWFTESAAGMVGRITKTGAFREWIVPGASKLTAMTAGPGGTVWFLDETANALGRLQIVVPGDTNDDGAVDVADVFMLINYLFAGGPAPK
jgi:streptogramin lyase